MPEIILAEQWKEINGFVGYQVSTRGRIRSRWKRRGSLTYLSDTWHDVKTSLASGRLIVTLGNGKDKSQKTFGVAFLVLSSFVRPANVGEVARHYLDPTPTNCRLGNLKWGSRSDNLSDIVRHKGRYHSSKLTPAQVIEIREELSKQPLVPGKRRVNSPCKALAVKYGVSAATIWCIEKGISQKMVPLD